MAGKVPYSKSNEAMREQNVLSESVNLEEFPATSSREYIGDILASTRTWSKMSGCSSEDTSHNQLQEQYMFNVDQCLTELKRTRRKNEEIVIHVKKIIRDKVEYVLKAVKQSFEGMCVDGTKQIEMKCEEIGRVMARVEKLLEETARDISAEMGNPQRERMMNSQKFVEDAMREKVRIETQAEAVIKKLNKMRETDEQIIMDFKEDIQQRVHSGILSIERNLEFQAEQQANLVEKKITEMRKALLNLQHLSKFS